MVAGREQRLVPDWRLSFSGDINSWGGRRKLPSRGVGCKHGRQGGRGHIQQLRGGHQQGPREGDPVRGLPGPQKYERTCAGRWVLWAARPPLSLSGSLGRAPPCSHVQACPDILCHTLHRRHKWPACWLAPTALHLLASPQLSCSQPHRHPVCVCVCMCVCARVRTHMCSSSACRTLCCLLISLGFAQTHMHSLIICCVSSLHACTQTHTSTPSFCPSASQLLVC